MTDTLFDPEKAEALISFQEHVAALGGNVEEYAVARTLIACVRCLALTWEESPRTVLENFFAAAWSDEEWFEEVEPQLVVRVQAEYVEAEREHAYYFDPEQGEPA